MSKPTKADTAYAKNKGAFLLLFSKVNAYRDKEASPNMCQYKGQNLRKTYDGLLKNTDVPAYLVVNQKDKTYKLVGKCVGRSYNDKVREKDEIPICNYRLSTTGMIESTKETPLDRTQKYCFMAKFLSDYGLTIITGKLGDGIVLVVKK
jgi:hypothetical protein